MEDFNKMRLINAVLFMHPIIDREKWFSLCVNYKDNVAREIYSAVNQSNQKEKASEKEDNFIRAVINFILNLYPQLPVSCSFIPTGKTANYDLSHCEVYGNLKKIYSPRTEMCHQQLTLQSRLEKCPDLKFYLIEATSVHANAYLNHLFGKPV
jgi:hypothetical protein